VAHTLIALVQNEPLVLSRVVGLLTRRGFTIEGISVGASETAGISRLTLVVETESVDQVVKQLERLVPVLAVLRTSAESALERESALVRVDAPLSLRASVMALCMAFQARVLAVSEGDMVLEIAAAPEDVQQFLTLLQPFGIQELARTGRIAMMRPSAPARDTAEAEEHEPIRRGWRPLELEPRRASMSSTINQDKNHGRTVL